MTEFPNIPIGPSISKKIYKHIMKKLIFGSLFCFICVVSFGQVSTFTDSRDSKVYNKVTIGTQTWMAENLNYEHDSSWCFSNDTAECSTYGRLYKWEQADTICPSGWHLPTDSEWKILEEYVGMSSSYSDLTGYRTSGDVGYYLKSASSWPTGGYGTDGYYFSVLPAGFRKPGGNFTSLGHNALFWTATDNESRAYGRLLFYQKGIERSLFTKQYGASVRCVKD